MKDNAKRRKAEKKGKHKVRVRRIVMKSILVIVRLLLSMVIFIVLRTRPSQSQPSALKNRMVPRPCPSLDTRPRAEHRSTHLSIKSRREKDIKGNRAQKLYHAMNKKGYVHGEFES